MTGISSLAITSVHFRPAPAIDQQAGLLGWASVVINDSLRLNNLGVRRTRDERISLTFPTRRDRRGKEHGIVSPISGAAHQTIEAAVLAELRRQGALP